MLVVSNIIPVLLLVLSLTAIYNMKFGEKIQNGVYLYIKTLPLTFLISMLVILFALVDLIGHLLIKNIVLILLILILPMFILLYMLYSCHVFDKYINAQYYPEIVGKGMYKKE